MIKTLVIALCLTSISAIGHAGLIQNGSFENLGGQTLTQTDGAWDYFPSIPNWTGHENLEIQTYVPGSATFVQAAHGNYYAELNAHPAQNGSFSLNQTFSTVANTVYNLEFYARKRIEDLNNPSIDDGAFFVNVGDLMDFTINTHVASNWTKYSLSFLATGSNSTLQFLSGQGGNDTIGHYIDNVSVTRAQPVSEPTGAAVLFTAGLMALYARRRKVNAEA